MSLRIPILISVLATLLQLVLAHRWGLLADEAYYAYWSEDLAWGYYDQPPLIAWLFALTRSFGELGVRLPAIGFGVLAPWVLLRHHAQQDLGLYWWIALPPLFWLTFFSTPDAPLLGFWSLGLAGALAGGPWWLLTGLAGGLGGLSKYTGLLLLPLCWAATRERSRWVAGAFLIQGLVLTPHLIWLAQHDLVSLRFQLHEGVANTNMPGLLGPPQVLLQQLGVLTPLTAIAIGWVWFLPTPDRTRRLAWWTSAPLLLGFLVASIGGPPEAHWPAPAWIGAGLLLSHVRGPLERLTWVGLGIGLLANLAVIAHVEVGLLQIPADPAHRVREGKVLAEAVGAWALPDGVGVHEPGVERSTPVFTERYQEAALIRWYSGIPARAHPNCGRPNQFNDLPKGSFLFVSPTTTHPPTCARCGPRHPLTAQDENGLIVGSWEIFEDCR